MSRFLLVKVHILWVTFTPAQAGFFFKSHRVSDTQRFLFFNECHSSFVTYSHRHLQRLRRLRHLRRQADAHADAHADARVVQYTAYDRVLCIIRIDNT